MPEQEAAPKKPKYFVQQEKFLSELIRDERLQFLNFRNTSNFQMIQRDPAIFEQQKYLKKFRKLAMLKPQIDPLSGRPRLPFSTTDDIIVENEDRISQKKKIKRFLVLKVKEIEQTKRQQLKKKLLDELLHQAPATPERSLTEAPGSAS
mmetsp:Transcript_10481/g.17580  ORF Transcript_10481/g.17580 Transcript_10481/m.17580 type:complete len:149 (+) Transcript_10481:655-1101(+)